MNQCPFQGADFSGDDLSGSSMVGTNFNNAELVGTKLHSSNMKNAVFRGANLCGADLSSSQLRNADFRGFAPLGRPTNLTLADLSSSGCAGIQTNQFTIICGTTWCDGTVRNDSCPGGPPPGACRPTIQTCDTRQAVCAFIAFCDGGPCECFFSWNSGDPQGQRFCTEPASANNCAAMAAQFGLCTDALACDPGFVCVSSCCNPDLGNQGFCWPGCGTPVPAARTSAERAADDRGAGPTPSLD